MQPARSRPAAVAAPPAGDTRRREQWADTAKGACILLVVLWHVIMKHYLRVDWQLGIPLPGAWGTAGELLLPMRMPLFFTISGLFAVGAVSRSWRSAARSRIAKFLYLYALWLAVHTAVFSLNPAYPTDRATTWLELLEQLTITPGNLWYLFALAGYFVIAKATRRLPVWAVLGPAVVLSAVAAADLLPAPGNRAGLYQNLAFFLAGLYFRPAIERYASAVTWQRFAAAAAAYAGALTAMLATGTQHMPGVWPAVCVIATAFGIAAAVLASRARRIGRPLAALGRRTLPIYVLHMPLLALADLALHGPVSAAAPGVQLVAALASPVLLTALAVWVCLALYRGLRHLGAHALFDLPGGSAPAGAPSTSSPLPKATR